MSPPNSTEFIGRLQVLGRAPMRSQPHAPVDEELSARAFLAEQRLSDLKGLLDEMRAERDAWRDQAQRLALTDQRERRPWWKRIAS